MSFITTFNPVTVNLDRTDAELALPVLNVGSDEEEASTQPRKVRYRG
jgi:hypothetical protein